MKFTKMHGLGNDYVYVNCFEEKIDNPSEVAIFVSDRHTGIGSDGLIMINPSKVADFEMEMYNADGSRGEMCGNGIRCVGKYVYDYGLTDKTSISVETLGGIKYLDLTVENVRKMSKHHPRCGTAFLFVVMIISILLFAIVPSFGVSATGYTIVVPNAILAYILNILMRIVMLPIVAGISYEFNRYAGAHDNTLTKILRAPGMAMQRFTTVEPEDDMIELAIVALTEALNIENEVPDYSAKDTDSENLTKEATETQTGEVQEESHEETTESSDIEDETAPAEVTE